MTDFQDIPSFLMSSPAAHIARAAMPGDESFQPLQPRAQANAKAMMNTITSMHGYLAALPEDVRNSLIQYDAQRVSTGASPLTKEQTTKVTQAAATGQAQTKSPQADWWDLPTNALNDLRGIISALPQMVNPQAYIKEFNALGDFSKEYQAQIDAGENPVTALSRSPGIRMIPGAFIAGNIMHPAELARHPLMTALDSTPYLSKLAEGTAVVKAADAAALAADELPKPPLRTVATKRLTPEGEVVDRATTTFAKNTRLGKAATEMFGNRPVWREAAAQEQMLQGIQQGVVDATTEPGRLLQKIRTLAEDHMPDQAQRVEFGRKISLGDFSGMSADELKLASELRDTQQQYAKAVAEATDGALQHDPFLDEWYTEAQAKKISEARDHAWAVKRISTLRDEYLSPSGTIDKDTLYGAVEQAAKGGRKHEFDALMRVADAYGLDTANARRVMHRAERLRTGNYDGVADAMRETIRTGELKPRIDPQELIRMLRGNRNHVQSRILAEAIASGDNKMITKALNNILAQTNSSPTGLLDNPEFLSSVRSYRDRVRWERKYGKQYTADVAERAATKAAKVVAENPSPRFRDVITDRVQKQAVTVLSRDMTAADVEKITQMVADGNWEGADRIRGIEPDNPTAVTTRKLYSDIEKDVSANWQALKAEGIDPIFKHRVGRGRAQSVVNPRIGPVPNTISQAVEASLDFTPTNDDWAVYMSHQGMEVMNRQATENFVDFLMEKGGGRTTQQLMDQYSPYARNTDSALNFQQQLRDVIGRDYELFNPDEKGLSWGGTRMDKYRNEEYWLPKPLANNLRRMTRGGSPILAAIDPATNAFRLSVVGLSPRAHLNNIIGGAVLTMGELGPIEFAKQIGPAWRMLKNPAAIEDELLRSSIGSFKREFLDTDMGRVRANMSYMEGARARRIHEQFIAAQEKVGENAVVQGVKKVAEKSLDINGKFDDMYRVMSYLHGSDKALTKGLTREGARRAGEELMRKTMMDFAGATPIERQVLRTIFPFYGFMRHSLAYVSRYPMEHPLRAGVIAAFSRAEQDDLGGLPLNWLSFIPIGGKDKNGNQRMLSVGALNPFNDAANMFTVAGWLGSTNPILSTAFESVGLERGKADLFPTLRYNPETGRLDADLPGFFSSLPGNIVPQINLLTAMLGVNSQFADMAHRDPASALRYLVSSAGLPVNYRGGPFGAVNVPQEYFKAEINRMKSQTDVKNAALASGDWSEAMRYPELRALLDQIRGMDPSALAQYQPQDQAQLVKQAGVLGGFPAIQSTGGI